MREHENGNHIEDLRSFLEIPSASADSVFDRFLEILGAIYRSEGLNRFLYVRGARPNKVLLVAHADTYWDREYGEKPGQTREIRIENAFYSTVWWDLP